MGKSTKSESVPKSMQEKFGRIVAITDEFAQQYLNDEYAQLIRYATAALCRKRPSPLASGRDKTWACGITHAIGMVNFLYDASQELHMSASDLYKAFGVSASSGQAKSKQVRDILGMHQMDPDWCLPSKMDDNLLAWMISVNGFLVDARSLPREMQEEALAKGLIPYIPGEKSDSTEKPTAIQEPESSVSQKKDSSQATEAVYVLDVYIIDGPVTEDFIEANPVVSRTIEIRGSQTLQDLHHILFEAFDREEEHLYEFQIGGRGPNDPKARRYGLKMIGDPAVKDVAKTTLASLGLSVGDMFGYWFDFGDDWWHQISVTEVKDKAFKGNYPKITQRVGTSPPQYAES
jgi:hypothetical protein